VRSNVIANRAESLRGALSHYFDSFGKIVAAATAFVALISSVVTLAYRFWPEGSAQPSGNVQAEIKFLRVIPRTSLRTYLFDSGQLETVSSYGSSQLSALGNYYQLDVRLEGLHKKPSYLLWSLVSAEEGSLVDEERWIHQPLSSVVPPDKQYRFTAKVWLQLPSLRGTFYGLIEVDHPENQTLATAQTPTFVGLLRPPRPSPGPTTTPTLTTPTLTAPIVTHPGSTVTLTTTAPTGTTTISATTTDTTPTNTTPPPTTTVTEQPAPPPIVRPPAIISAKRKP
jgi:hypothetical protein